MLVLSRSKGERVVIRVGRHVVTVQVVAVRGKKVRIGFEAPADVLIHRAEIWNRIGACNGDGELPVGSGELAAPVFSGAERNGHRRS